MEIDYSKYPLPKKFRHHTAANFYFKYSELKEKPNYYPPLVDNINWESVFINCKKPAMLDIGCGKGVFLLNMSGAYSDKNILGLEVRKPAVNWINGVVKGEGIINCAALWYSVVNGLDFIESESIEKVFYLFPDPWVKRRQMKRRAFNDDFLNDTYRVLAKDGELFLATDVPEVDIYHKKILNKFDKYNYFSITDDTQWQFPVTNKEKFCRKKEIPIFRIVCRK